MLLVCPVGNSMRNLVGLKDSCAFDLVVCMIRAGAEFLRALALRKAAALRAILSAKDSVGRALACILCLISLCRAVCSYLAMLSGSLS